MPVRAARRCSRCHRARDAKGNCPSGCARRSRERSQRARGSSTQQGYGHEHRTRFRAPVLARDPICVVCGKAPSTEADHWPRSRKQLASAGLDPNDPRYGRGLCKPCHSAETARNQPGGWNRR